MCQMIRTRCLILWLEGNWLIRRHDQWKWSTPRVDTMPRLHLHHFHRCFHKIFYGHHQEPIWLQAISARNEHGGPINGIKPKDIRVLNGATSSKWKCTTWPYAFSYSQSCWVMAKSKDNLECSSPTYAA
jgi:hypothetical protein